MTGPDAFDAAYTQGVSEALGHDRSAAAATRVRDLPLDPRAALPCGLADAPPAAATATAFAGSVLTGTGSLARAWVVVDAGRITEVRSTKPHDIADIIDTDRVLLPRLIDLKQSMTACAMRVSPTRMGVRCRRLSARLPVRRGVQQ